MSEAGMSMDFAGEDRERLAAMGKRQILIVEDEFVNREILKAYLEPEYEVLCAETGEEAREKIRAGFDIISLILLDLNLPDMHGMDILRWIRDDTHFSKIPVIVITSDKESEVESLNIGAADFITKPYPMPEVIRARIRRIIELNETRDLIREKRSSSFIRRRISMPCISGRFRSSSTRLRVSASAPAMERACSPVSASRMS